MNYKKIHDNLISYLRCKSSKERIEKRNKNDKRLKNDFIYVEVHHIIPRSLGGLDEDENLVEVLPEEHLFIHMLRYKIFRKREDALAVRFMLNGFSSKSISRGSHKVFITKKIRMGYSWLRTHAYFLRNSEGWHTPEGIVRIAEARKGKMPARDIKTGQLVGNVSLQHPKVLSGDWVHHSKGRKYTQEQLIQHRIRMTGQGNSNASGLSDEYFIEKGIEAFKEFGRILSWSEMINLSAIKNFQWIKSSKSRFNRESTRGYYKILENRTNTKYDKYASRKTKSFIKPIC